MSAAAKKPRAPRQFRREATVSTTLGFPEALESARLALIVAHDRLILAASNPEAIEGAREAQTVLKVLARSFLHGDAGTESRSLRRSFAREASKKLSRRLEPRDGKESARLPFGPALDPRRAVNLHAEHVAWSLQPGLAKLESDSALASFAVFLLRFLNPSPIGTHIAARHKEQRIADADLKRLGKRLQDERGKGRGLTGERVVVLALQAIGWPKPANVFSRKDK